jgi:hypothetical protein
VRRGAAGAGELARGLEPRLPGAYNDPMAGRRTVLIELAADAQHARDLSAGGVFVPGCALALNEECALVVRGAAGELRLEARVVFLDPGRGAGLELIGFGAEMKEQLWALAGEGGGLALGSGELDLPAEDGGAAGDGDDRAVGSAAAAADDECADPGGAAARAGPPPSRDRLRYLPLAQQIRRANSAELQERILLERRYGKNVWEALLRNPRLTAPEVARIARMGMLPRPLIELIVGNGAWLQMPEVRRALLANPRLQTDQILRVLRVLPKHELRLAAVQASYPYPVRDAAKRLLREQP